MGVVFSRYLHTRETDFIARQAIILQGLKLLKNIFKKSLKYVRNQGVSYL